MSTAIENTAATVLATAQTVLASILDNGISNQIEIFAIVSEVAETTGIGTDILLDAIFLLMDKQTGAYLE